jgi:hypothetical protein
VNQEILIKDITITGIALATCMSYVTNKSILWAILHGPLSWYYVIYRAMGYGSGA